MKQLPDIHDATIIGISKKSDDLVITLETDGGYELVTFYLKDCKRSTYWYELIRKSALEGFTCRGFRYRSDSVDRIDLKKHELVIHSHTCGSLNVWKGGKMVKYELTPQKSVLRIEFGAAKVVYGKVAWSSSHRTQNFYSIGLSSFP